MTTLPHPKAHPAPAGGWVSDPDQMVPAETMIIRKHLGVQKMSDADYFELTCFCAVALARREDPTIPWEAALYITPAELVSANEDQADPAAALEDYQARLAETAITGEDPGPDPA